MLTLWAGQPECLWDETLPIEVRELPQDLAALDGLLSDPELSMVFLERWRREVIETGRLVLTDGRPTIAMETYVRLMVLKQRYRWGYRSLVAEVSDSIHLRRFCRIALCERVPDESTVRKLTRRIGPETVNELTRAVIVEATRSKRFRPRAVRIDSTVIEADVKYPTDANLAADGVKVLAREGRKLAKLVGEKRARVRDRSRSMGRKLRAVTRTIRRRSGEAKKEVLALTGQTGQLLQKSVTEAKALAAASSAGSWCEGQAPGGRPAGGVRRSVREGCRADSPSGGGRGDQGPDRVALRSRRPADPQGQVGEAQRIWVRGTDRGGDRAHPPRRARPDPPRVNATWEPGRGRAAARYRRRAPAARDLGAGGRVGWRVQYWPDPRSARRPRTRASLHLWPPTTRLQTHPTTPTALPNRCGSPDQSPQTRLRTGSIPAQRRRRPADLDRMGGPGLQR